MVDLERWNRFTLDLAEIIEAEPGAVYQISLNFRKSQSLYFCAESGGSDDEDEELSVGNWDNPDEPSYWEFDDYSYEDYNWSQRDNPCHGSYYRYKSVSKILFASDLGIIAKSGDGGNLHVFVTNLLTTKPEAAEVQVYNFQQQLIAQGATSSEGIAEIEIPSKPFAIVVKKGDQTGYLKISDGSALSLSNFDVFRDKNCSKKV